MVGAVVCRPRSPTPALPESLIVTTADAPDGPPPFMQARPSSGPSRSS